ncbi:hypothetical protein LCGC14_2166940 [marine sediment metagenome]|uniref:Uncharacterized protein n=1 Tax=marine sediment metagenome TaxID=412755 RepID=A0A0F9DRA2_9ZZZZ
MLNWFRRVRCLLRGHDLRTSDLAGIGKGPSYPGDTEVAFRCYRGGHYVRLFFHAHDWVRGPGDWHSAPQCACGDGWNGTVEEYFAWADKFDLRNVVKPTLET